MTHPAIRRFVKLNRPHLVNQFYHPHQLSWCIHPGHRQQWFQFWQQDCFYLTDTI